MGFERGRRGGDLTGPRRRAVGTDLMPGALNGFTIIEMAGLGPAPYAAMLLADMGADVIRVDRPGGGTAHREPRFDVVSRGRRSIAIDLKHPAGVTTLLE